MLPSSPPKTLLDIPLDLPDTTGRFLVSGHPRGESVLSRVLSTFAFVLMDPQAPPEAEDECKGSDGDGDGGGGGGDGSNGGGGGGGGGRGRGDDGGNSVLQLSVDSDMDKAVFTFSATLEQVGAHACRRDVIGQI